MNALLAWNLAAVGDKHRKVLLPREFVTSIAEYFMSYRRTREELINRRVSATAWHEVDERISAALSTHRMVQVAYGPRCAVCRLEHGMNASLRQAGMAKNVLLCSKYNIPAHPYIPWNSTRQIHRMKEFEGLSRFEILHTDEGMTLWTRNSEGRHRYTPRQSYPIVKRLREFHGATRRSGERQRPAVDDDFK